MDWLGYCAAFCTTIAFVPQVVHTWKSRDTSGISLGMYLVFVTGVAFWLAYGIARRDLPITAANALTLALSGSVLALKLREG